MNKFLKIFYKQKNIKIKIKIYLVKHINKIIKNLKKHKNIKMLKTYNKKIN